MLLYRQVWQHLFFCNVAEIEGWWFCIVTLCRN